jgi:phenylacetate-CoA ligase
MPYTGRDLDQWGECLGRCYAAASAARGDRIQIISSSALFNGGFGFYQGARAAGLVLIPSGAGNYRRLARLAADFRSRVLVAPAESGAGMLRAARETGIGLPTLQIGIFGGEPVSAELREIAREQGIEIFDVYGLTETGGLGTVGMECSEHGGLHVWEDQCLVEVVDPGTGRARPDGEEGELLVTTLTREALPVLRYRTGDLTRVLSREKCACGRTLLRIAPVIPAGRTEHRA